MKEMELDTPRGRFGGLRNGNTGAPPLLALHGWLDNAASFQPMAPSLAGYDLVALDMPGHGRSFHYREDSEYSLFSALLDIGAAADALGWTRFTLLGHSMGGALATLFAAAAPHRVERLCLVEALGPLAAPEEGTAARLRDALSERGRLGGKFKRVFRDRSLAVQVRMEATVTPLDEASARLLVERGMTAVEGGHQWSSDARLTVPTAVRLTEGQVRDCLRALTCPVGMVVADPPPPYFPPGMRDERVACVSDIRMTVMSGSHHLHMTHPREVVAALGL